MNKKEFLKRVKENILVIDGAIGTMLQSHIPKGTCEDHANLVAPEVVIDVHRQYADAGADIIITNTFGANRVKLAEFDLQDKVKEINTEGARLAREGAGEKALIAGSVGPTGKLIEPLGDLGFDEAYEAYKEQASILAEAGVDLFIMETFSDLKEARVALMAVRDSSDLPVMISMTFKDDFTTFTGTDPITAANVLSSLGADVIGVNCTTGPEPMLEVLGRMALATDKPLFVEPNAVIYGHGEEGSIYHVSPEEMARFAQRFVDIGANITGSCCGSTPEHTRELKKAVGGRVPLARSVQPKLRLSSRYQTIEVGSDQPFCVVGERLNPTNREDLSGELSEGKISVAQDDAKSQETQGAHLLDVNIGVPGIDEPLVMKKVIRGVETASRLPIAIDSVSPQAVEAALKEVSGKALINSVTGEEKSLNTILPLAAKFGAGLICLAVDDDGIPQKAEDRLRVLKKIVAEAEKYGIPRENLICDCVTLTVSAQQKRAQETLRAIELVKSELGLPTILGVSNISYGLPDRTLINSTFISMCMAAGLDAAIMNPGDTRMMETVTAASVLTVRDKNSQEYVKAHVKKKKKKKKKTESTVMVSDEDKLIYRAVVSGDSEGVGGLIEKAVNSGKSAQGINDNILIPAIEEVGKKYDNKEIFLPQMLLSAETFQAAFQVLEPHFDIADAKPMGTVLMCTVKGDVHDIGKNIVGLFLKNHGFKVIDLGKNISAEVILEKVREYSADVVGLSALMTTTMTEMPKVIELFKKEGITAKVMVGGAVVTKKYAKEIGAHGYAKDGVSAVETIKNILSLS